LKYLQETFTAGVYQFNDTDDQVPGPKLYHRLIYLRIPIWSD